MQMNQVTGKPVGFGFSNGPTGNFLSPINSRGGAISSSGPAAMSSRQCAQSSGMTVISSRRIGHTSDVVKTLREHPAFMHMPEGEIDAIAAAIISVGVAAGGLVLLALSGGASAPFSIALASISLTSAGAAGAAKAIEGGVNGRFDWGSWGRDVAISGGTSLLTFGVGYASGAGITYALIQSTRLSALAAKSVAIGVGSLLGAGIHDGSYILKCMADGGQVETLSLVLHGIGGMIEGGSAAHLGARVGAKAAAKAAARSEKVLMRMRNGGTEVELYQEPIETQASQDVEVLEERFQMMREGVHQASKPPDVFAGNAPTVKQLSPQAEMAQNIAQAKGPNVTKASFKITLHKEPGIHLDYSPEIHARIDLRAASTRAGVHGGVETPHFQFEGWQLVMEEGVNAKKTGLHGAVETARSGKAPVVRAGPYSGGVETALSGKAPVVRAGPYGFDSWQLPGVNMPGDISLNPKLPIMGLGKPCKPAINVNLEDMNNIFADPRLPHIKNDTPFFNKLDKVLDSLHIDSLYTGIQKIVFKGYNA